MGPLFPGPVAGIPALPTLAPTLAHKRILHRMQSPFANLSSPVALGVPRPVLHHGHQLQVPRVEAPLLFASVMRLLPLKCFLTPSQNRDQAVDQPLPSAIPQLPISLAIDMPLPDQTVFLHSSRCLLSCPVGQESKKPEPALMSPAQPVHPPFKGAMPPGQCPNNARRVTIPRQGGPRRVRRAPDDMTAAKSILYDAYCMTLSRRAHGRA